MGILDAFDDGEDTHAPGDGTFPGLEAAQARSLRALPDEISMTLRAEVDRGQAAMFARRFSAVAALLERLAESRPEARLLRSGLAARAAGVLAASGPRALRFRSLVDFYYSAAALLHHEERLAADGRTLTTMAELIDAAPWRKIAPGLFHRIIAGDGPRGPVHINALRFDRSRFSFRVRDLRGEGLDGRSFATFAGDAGAVAAVSGGFFLYSEHDIEAPSRRYDPIGLLVSDRVVRWPPLFRRGTFLQDVSGHCHVREVGLAGVTIEGPASILVAGVNPRIRRVEAPVAFTRVRGPEVRHAGPSLTFCGRTVTARGDRGVRPIPLNGFVLCLPDRAEWRDLAAAFSEGAEVSYRLPDHGGAPDVRDAIAAGPVLLRDGRRVLDLDREDFLPGVPPATFSGDETGDRNLLPRLAAGLTADHEVILAAADGRNFSRALGLTLRDTAKLMATLGCVDALNLDGGSSKRMVLQGRTLDLPTTEVVDAQVGSDERRTTGEQPVRPVNTGFLVFEE